MVASSSCIAECNTALNVIVAEEFKNACDVLENAENFEESAMEYIAKTLREHQRVIFNGNGYSEEWVEEAKRRGLPNVKTYCEAIESATSEKTIQIFEDLKVLSKKELEARAEIMYETYINAKDIEAKTALNMAKQQYLPAVRSYVAILAKEAEDVKKVYKGDVFSYTAIAQKALELLDKATKAVDALEVAATEAQSKTCGKCMAYAYKDLVVPALEALREPIDALEEIVDKDYWPVPSYADLMFEV